MHGCLGFICVGLLEGEEGCWEKKKRGEGCFYIFIKENKKWDKSLNKVEIRKCENKKGG